MSAIPVPYTSGQTIQGHYSCAQKSGNAVSIAAAGNIASLRYTGSGYLTLMRLRVGYSVQAAITACPQFDFKALRVTAFTADTDGTAGAPCKMRSIMSASAAVPRICTTAAMSTGTTTTDGVFAAAPVQGIVATNATGTVVTMSIGVIAPMTTLYEWTGLGQHPVVCAANEGVLLQLFTANNTTGAVNYYVQWEWSESPSF